MEMLYYLLMAIYLLMVENARMSDSWMRRFLYVLSALMAILAVACFIM